MVYKYIFNISFYEIKKFKIEKVRVGKILANENNMLRPMEYKSR